MMGAPGSWRTRALTLTGVVACAAFATAGVLKLRDPLVASAAVVQTFPWISASAGERLATSIAVLEIAVSLCAPAGPFARPARWTGLSLCAAFLAFSVCAAGRGVLDCGCFGALALANVLWVRITVLAAASAWFAYQLRTAVSHGNVPDGAVDE